jgi:hypothetical protein
MACAIFDFAWHSLVAFVAPASDRPQLSRRIWPYSPVAAPFAAAAVARKKVDTPPAGHFHMARSCNPTGLSQAHRRHVTPGKLRLIRNRKCHTKNFPYIPHPSVVADKIISDGVVPAAPEKVPLLHQANLATNRSKHPECYIATRVPGPISELEGFTLFRRRTTSRPISG